MTYESVRDMRARLAWILLACLTLTVVASGQTVESEARVYKELVVKLAGEEFAGRGTGSEGEDKARDWLAEQYAAAGLNPARGKSYIQPFDLKAGAKIVDQQLRYRIGQGKWISLAAGKDFAAMQLSAAGSFSAEPVFGGYGIADRKRGFDSFGQADKKIDRVLVVFRYEPHDDKGVSLWSQRPGGWTRQSYLQTKVSQAEEVGAKALLVVNPPAHADADFLGASVGRSGGKMPVYHLSLDAFSDMLTAAGMGAEKKLAELKSSADKASGLIELPGLTLAGEVELEPRVLQADNVVAVLGGAGNLAGEVIVLGAHYDHLGRRGESYMPGADDNASGTAAVVLLARRLVKAWAGDQTPRRTVLFVNFSGEELGLHGSRYFLKHLDQVGLKKEQITAMVNFDMVGRSRSGKLSVSGVGSAEAWASLIDQAAGGTDLKVTQVPGTWPSSDQYSFHREGIPSLFFNTGMHGDLHKPTDTAEKIKSVPAVQVVRLAENLTRALATRPERLTFVEAKADKGGYLGVGLESTADGKAIRLTHVVPDSPADKGGLVAGDLITAAGRTSIDSAASLVKHLRSRKPGDRVKLTVQRDGQTREIEVTLGKR
ncbi:MAG: M20/M25/M40 family metallo-hydrolase [Planctomycetota bacterium]